MKKTVQVSELEIVAQGTKHHTALFGAIEVENYVSCTEVYVKFAESGVKKKTTTQAIRAGRLTTSVVGGQGKKNLGELTALCTEYELVTLRAKEIKEQIRGML